MYALTILTDKRTAAAASCAAHYKELVERETGAEELDALYGEHDDSDEHQVILISEHDLRPYAGHIEWHVDGKVVSCTATCLELGVALDSTGCTAKFDTSKVAYEMYTQGGYMGMAEFGFPSVAVKVTYMPMGNSEIAMADHGVRRCRQKALMLLQMSVASTVERTLAIRKYGEKEGLKRLHDLPTKLFKGREFEAV